MKRVMCFLMLLLLLVSCKTVRTIEVPVEVPVVKTEYVNHTDSIYLHDSIYHTVITKGDTVYDVLYKYKVYEKYLTDTVIRVDSIPVVVPVETIKEVNRLYWWLKSLMWIGGVLLALGVIILIFKLKR